MSSRSKRSEEGFTLIELIVVIAVIAVLASVVAPQVIGSLGAANEGAARSQIDIFGLALDQYRLDNHRYPSTEQGLAALRRPPVHGEAPGWKGPYLKKAIPPDPWGRPYHYVSPGRVNPDSYDLYSLGRDGREGGTGEDADLTSWGEPLR